MNFCIISALPLWGLLIVWKIYERFIKKKSPEKDKETYNPEEDGVNKESQNFIEPV